MIRIRKKLGAVKATTVSDLHKELFRSIILGEIHPGEVLSEEALAVKFGVSRTPVREVLIHLQNEGLLLKGPWRGYSVSEMSLESLKEVFHIRLILEPEAARLAALNPVALQFLQMGEKVLADMKAMSLRSFLLDDLFEMGELDSAFHLAIAEASGSKTLAKTIEMIRKQTQRFWAIMTPANSILRDTVEEHQAILDAINARDSQRAKQLMQHHVQNAAERGLRLEQGTASSQDLLQPSI
jgi:GntR family transcriptional regulator, rspAB operon transcriptional repressor